MIAVDILGGGIRLLRVDDAAPVVKNPNIAIYSPFQPGIALSADNRWVAILDIGCLRLFDATAKLRAGAIFPCTGAFAVAPHSEQLAVADGKTILLCDLISNKTRNLLCNEEISALKYIGEDELVAATGNNMMLLNAASGQATMRLTHREWIMALAISPDGRTVAIGDNRGDVVLWDLLNGNSVALRVRNRNKYLWTVPAAILAVFLSFFVYRQLSRSHSHHPPLDA